VQFKDKKGQKGNAANSAPPTVDSGASTGRDSLEALADALRALTAEQRAQLAELLRDG